MRNAKLVLGAVFALTLASGIGAGMLVSRLPMAGARPAPGADTTQPARITMLEQALKLKPDQQQQMQKIWERVRDTTDSCYTEAQDLQKEQWAKLADILTPDEKVKFNSVQSEYQKKFDELKSRREAEFKKAVADTDQILTGEQSKQFHEIIEKRLGETPPWLAPPKLPTGPLKGSGA